MPPASYPADQCPNCDRPLRSEHRQLMKRLYICPNMGPLWRFALDDANRLVVMAIGPTCDQQRAKDIVIKSEAGHKVSDGPATHRHRLATPFLEDPEKRMTIIPARTMPKLRPGQRRRSN